MSIHGAMMEHESLRLLMHELAAQFKATPWWRFRRRMKLAREFDKAFERACTVFDEAMARGGRMNGRDFVWAMAGALGMAIILTMGGHIR